MKSTQPSCTCRLVDQLERLESDNTAIKADNERLCRIVDSGAWGQQRVEELLQAGRVLQAERDALAQLATSLQANATGGGALHDATNSPEAAPAAAACLQYRISAAGIQPAAGSDDGLIPTFRPASPGAAVAARNKLLVRNGSSFNAMVRALKQDLLASGALQRGGPAAVLEVDKVGC